MNNLNTNASCAVLALNPVVVPLHILAHPSACFTVRYKSSKTPHDTYDYTAEGRVSKILAYSYALSFNIATSYNTLK